MSAALAPSAARSTYGSTPRVRPSGAALQLDPSHRSSPTSAVCRGRARLFKGLAKKSALHFEPRDQGRMDTEAFREVQPQAIQEAGLGGVGAYAQAQGQLAAVRGGQHEVDPMVAAGCP